MSYGPSTDCKNYQGCYQSKAEKKRLLQQQRPINDFWIVRSSFLVVAENANQQLCSVLLCNSRWMTIRVSLNEFVLLSTTAVAVVTLTARRRRRQAHAAVLISSYVGELCIFIFPYNFVRWLSWRRPPSDGRILAGGFWEKHYGGRGLAALAHAIEQCARLRLL